MCGDYTANQARLDGARRRVSVTVSGVDVFVELYDAQFPLAAARP